MWCGVECTAWGLGKRPLSPPGLELCIYWDCDSWADLIIFAAIDNSTQSHNKFISPLPYSLTRSFGGQRSPTIVLCSVHFAVGASPPWLPPSVSRSQSLLFYVSYIMYVRNCVDKFLLELSHFFFVRPGWARRSWRHPRLHNARFPSDDYQLLFPLANLAVQMWLPHPPSFTHVHPSCEQVAWSLMKLTDKIMYRLSLLHQVLSQLYISSNENLLSTSTQNGNTDEFCQWFVYS